jgi:hypothetical protein
VTPDWHTTQRPLKYGNLRTVDEKVIDRSIKVIAQSVDKDVGRYALCVSIPAESEL